MNNLTTYNEFLNEGRYDALTGNTVKKMWPIIKATRVAGEKHYTLDMGEIEFNGVYFDLELQITRMSIPIAQGFILDAGAYTTKGDNTIEIIIKIDPKIEPKNYVKLNSKLRDAVRHEIEHLTQRGVNGIPGKLPTHSTQATRNKITVDNKNIYKYFILPEEIPAMVHGMYAQAKSEKQTLDAIFDEYLDYFIGENIITKGEKEKVLKIWFKYAKANLPAAQYSTDK